MSQVAKPPVMCPYCGKEVRRKPFGASLASDNKEWFFIRSEEDPSALIGSMQMWACTYDKTHVFFHSTDP
jgi:hypothetical protein